MTCNGDAPLACTLIGGSYQERLEWIAQLNRAGLRRHDRQDLVLDLRYAPEVSERVVELVRKEEECCAFLKLDLVKSTNEVRLTITAPERARDVADLVFEQFIAPASQVPATASVSSQSCCAGDGTDCT